jgi:hypothetical protein
MRKLLMIAVLALLPVASQAQFTLGLRLGYSPAMGDAEQDFAMSDYVKSQIPIQVDAMYNFTPAFSAGGYLSYGFGQVGGDTQDLCDAFEADCSATSLRIGVQGAYAFNGATPTFTPWLGAGIGYEILSFDGGAGSVDTSGFEFLNLQGGGDYKVNDQFAIGPYVQLSFAQYSSVESADIANTGMHEWLTFGLRGKFDL